MPSIVGRWALPPVRKRANSRYGKGWNRGSPASWKVSPRQPHRKVQNTRSCLLTGKPTALCLFLLLRPSCAVEAGLVLDNGSTLYTFHHFTTPQHRLLTVITSVRVSQDESLPLPNGRHNRLSSVCRSPLCRSVPISSRRSGCAHGGLCGAIGR